MTTKKSLLLIVLILSVVFQIELRQANGIIEGETHNATTILKEIDNNLTSSMISLALSQVNDSQSSVSEDALLDSKMASSTISDLITGLAIKNEGNPCPAHENFCIIGDLKLALNSLKEGDPKMATKVLSKIHKQITHS